MVPTLKRHRDPVIVDTIKENLHLQFIFEAVILIKHKQIVRQTKVTQNIFSDVSFFCSFVFHE